MGKTLRQITCLAAIFVGVYFGYYHWSAIVLALGCCGLINVLVINGRVIL